MAYKCDKHGDVGSEWCTECKELIACDCSEITGNYGYVEIKEWRAEVYVEYCDCCGSVKDVRLV